MRLTRAGVATAIAVPALGVLAWLFGQPELAIVATALCAGLVAAGVSVRRHRPVLELRRHIRPARVAVEDPCQVVLSVRNTGRTRTSVLSLTDDVGRFGAASLHLAPLPRGATREATYSFPTHRRGLHPVGPLTVETTDAFGLLRSRQTLSDTRTLIVVPRTVPLAELPPAPGDEPEHGARVLSSAATVDESFASMRPYTVGDDIRRIHWRTTARVGELVVRQHDQPWQRRTTVLLDVRRSGADDADAAFERAVSAAASVIRSAAARHELVRLLSTDGDDSGFVALDDRADALMDRLAAVTPAPTSSLTATVSQLDRRSTGRLVTCAMRLEQGEVDGWERGTTGFGVRVLVTTAGPAPTSQRGVATVHWDGRRNLPEIWDPTVRSMGRVVR